MEGAKLNLLFFDHNDKIEDYRTAIGEEGLHRVDGVPVQCYFLKTDVKDLIKDYRIDCIVSPANSLGFMDGGIDMIYMQLFPGIQTTVQDRIKTFGITTALGRHVLPIGSAMLVGTASDQCPLLACVPTMFLPENITKTRNVYWAIRGLLHLCKSSFFTDEGGCNVTVAIPCMGTGVGKLSGEASAQQVKEALHDITTGSKAVAQQRGTYVWADENGDPPKHAYVLTNFACPQPENYANTEIQETEAKEIEVRVEGSADGKIEKKEADAA